MSKEPIEYLKHIRDECSFILSVIPEDFSKNEFLSDETLQRGIVRSLEIIGEAINTILVVEPDIQISSARQIVNTRNFIIHQYEEVSDQVLWSILIKHLPLLRTEVHNLINQRLNNH